MDAVTATLLAQATREVTDARRLIVSGQTVEATVILGEALGTLAAVERRFVEGRI